MLTVDNMAYDDATAGDTQVLSHQTGSDSGVAGSGAGGGCMVPRRGAGVVLMLLSIDSAVTVHPHRHLRLLSIPVAHASLSAPARNHSTCEAEKSCWRLFLPRLISACTSIVL
jgi:hypothetical protein